MVQQENVHHGVHLVGEFVPVDTVHQSYLHLVLHQIVHTHHHLLDHRIHPIELVEHALEGSRCTHVSFCHLALYC